MNYEACKTLKLVKNISLTGETNAKFRQANLNMNEKKNGE